MLPQLYKEVFQRMHDVYGIIAITYTNKSSLGFKIILECKRDLNPKGSELLSSSVGKRQLKILT